MRFERRFSGEPLPPLTIMPSQFAADAGARSKRMGAAVVPSARRRPPAATVMLAPEARKTEAPGLIVRVTPFGTVREALTFHGPPLAVQFSLLAREPLRVAPEAPKKIV